MSKKIDPWEIHILQNGDVMSFERCDQCCHRVLINHGVERLIHRPTVHDPGDKLGHKVHEGCWLYGGEERSPTIDWSERDMGVKSHQLEKSGGLNSISH